MYSQPRTIFIDLYTINNCTHKTRKSTHNLEPTSFHLFMTLTIKFQCITIQLSNFYNSRVRQQKLKWSYSHGLARSPLIGATIGQLLEDMTNKKPDEEAVIFVQDGVRRTFSQMLEQVRFIVYLMGGETHTPRWLT